MPIVAVPATIAVPLAGRSFTTFRAKRCVGLTEEFRPPRRHARPRRRGRSHPPPARERLKRASEARLYRG